MWGAASFPFRCARCPCTPVWVRGSRSSRRCPYRVAVPPEGGGAPPALGGRRAAPVAPQLRWVRGGGVGGPPPRPLSGLCGRGGVWFGLGQGLCRTPWPMVSTRLCADTTGLGESRLSGPKACRTVDRPRTPWWHTREGDAAVPVCVARAGQEGGACMLVALAGHDGSHGCAAPGPARWRRCRSSVSGFPRCGLVRPCRRL